MSLTLSVYVRQCVFQDLFANWANKSIECFGIDGENVEDDRRTEQTFLTMPMYAHQSVHQTL